jgi:hypothetical protein
MHEVHDCQSIERVYRDNFIILAGSGAEQEDIIFRMDADDSGRIVALYGKKGVYCIRVV